MRNSWKIILVLRRQSHSLFVPEVPFPKSSNGKKECDVNIAKKEKTREEKATSYVEYVYKRESV